MTLPSGVVLRPATLDDAAAGSRMHLACWRETYSPLVEADVLDARLSNEATWEDAWREQIRWGGDRLLAVAGDELVGFAVCGPSRDDLAVEELYALYVRSAWWGSGIGQALLEEVLGDRPASLWVLESNARAVAFYARNGFCPDGAREFTTWLDAWEIRLTR